MNNTVRTDAKLFSHFKKQWRTITPAMVDSGMYPLLEELNRYPNLVTIFSCSSHPKVVDDRIIISARQPDGGCHAEAMPIDTRFYIQFGYRRTGPDTLLCLFHKLAQFQSTTYQGLDLFHASLTYGVAAHRLVNNDVDRVRYHNVVLDATLYSEAMRDEFIAFFVSILL